MPRNAVILNLIVLSSLLLPQGQYVFADEAANNGAPIDPTVNLPEAPAHRPEPVTDLLSARLLKRPAMTTGLSAAEQAYAIQNQLLERLIGTTNLPIGYKVALANNAVQAQFGVTEPISGMLTLDMRRYPSQGLPLGVFPRFAEVEVALVIADDIREVPENIVALSKKISGVRVVLEVPALRFASRPSGYDLIADNAGAEHIVLGPVIPLADVRELSHTSLSWYDGTELHTVSQPAPQVQPLMMLQWLAKHLAERETFIPAGALIFTGAALPPQPLPSTCKEIHASIQGLGELRIRCVP
jgi:2-keto-4-pentenoate hydratase